MNARAVARGIATLPTAAAARARTVRWRPWSHLFVATDGTGWVLDGEAGELKRTASRLGVLQAPQRWARYASRQAIFHCDQFAAVQPLWTSSSHRLGFSYFHGRPGTPGMPEFDLVYEGVRRDPLRFDRFQVTHAEIHDLLVGIGVPEDRIHRIPIGIDIEHFPRGDAVRRAAARAALGLPQSAFVAGSFQKDGVGWGEGLTPKLIKGPDVLVEVLARVHSRLPELVVLLTGPARGYVLNALADLGIPFVHREVASRNDLAQAYHALDAYLVTSRQEGGPKGALEAMAAGVPLVATRVGQTQELVENGRTGFLADVDDVETLVAASLAVADGSVPPTLLDAARATAESVACERLDERWAALLDGFVELRR